jgi:hypothetical protein
MALASYDHFRFALAYLQVRAFLLDMAYLDLQSAYSGVVFSALNVVSATAAAVMQASAAALTADEGVGAVMFLLGGAMGIAVIVEAVAEFVDVIVGLVGSIGAVNEAGAARIEAEVHAGKMLAAADATARYAVELDKKGLLP